MHDDNDLRARFRALGDEDASATVPLTHVRTAAGRRPWYAPRRLAVLGASLAAAVLILSIGLVLGTSTGYASARVEGERQRDEIAATTDGVTRQLDALNLALVRTRAGLAQLATAKGTTSLSAAEAEIDLMRANVARIALNLTNHATTAAPPRPALAILRRLPMNKALTALSCVAILSQPSAAAAQQGIPVVDLPAAATKTTQTLGVVLAIHEAPDGKVLVNDGGRRQLKLFDSTLAGATTVLDSTPGTSANYGGSPATLIPYAGDSLLFPDFNSRVMLVLDSHGQVVRSLALPNVQHLRNIGREASATDNKGRLIYRGNWAVYRVPGSASTYSDSVPLLRADFDLRRVDTIGQVARPLAKAVGTMADGRTITALALNPLATVDDWAVLSDGSVAIVRGGDYHIDWVRPNGTTMSTPKLPFDWKRVTDDDKRRLADSTQAAVLAGVGSPPAQGIPNSPAPAGAGGRSGGGGGSTNASGDGGGRCGIGCGNAIVPRPAEAIPADKLPDFYPPLRVGATMADLEDNLWILPRTSAQSQHGELVYDVVNTKGEMVRRVRVPLGRLIVGFGKGGVIYMTSGDNATGFYLERSRLPAVGTPKAK